MPAHLLRMRTTSPLRLYSHSFSDASATGLDPLPSLRRLRDTCCHALFSLGNAIVASLCLLELNFLINVILCYLSVTKHNLSLRCVLPGVVRVARASSWTISFSITWKAEISSTN